MLLPRHCDGNAGLQARRYTTRNEEAQQVGAAYLDGRLDRLLRFSCLRRLRDIHDIFVLWLRDVTQHVHSETEAACVARVHHMKDR